MSAIIQAGSVVAAGGILAYPTETFYGLGADPFYHDAIEKICELKSRQPEMGIPLIASAPEVVETIVGSESESCSEKRKELQTKFWPGPLTCVITPRDDFLKVCSPLVLGPEQSVAVRVSGLALARELALNSGGFLTTTSANLHGQPPARTAVEVQGYFPELFVLPGADPLTATSPSTIVDVRRFPFTVLREGAIERAALAAWLS